MDDNIVTYNERYRVITKAFEDEKHQIAYKLQNVWHTVEKEVKRDVVRILNLPSDIESLITEITCPYLYFIGHSVCDFHIVLTLGDFKLFIRCDYNNTDFGTDYILSTGCMQITEFYSMTTSYVDMEQEITESDFLNPHYRHPGLNPKTEEWSILTAKSLIKGSEILYPNLKGSKHTLRIIFKCIRALADRYLQYPILDTRRSVLLILGRYQESNMHILPSEMIVKICKMAMYFPVINDLM